MNVVAKLNESKQAASKWAALFYRALPECEDVEEACLVADLAMESLPASVELAIVEEKKVAKEGIFLAWDIENRKAQGILNRAIEVAKKINKSARIDLEKALKTDDPTEISRALLAFVGKYRIKLADLLTTTQLASLLEGAREVAKSIPVVPMFPGAAIPPATLEPVAAVELLERLHSLPVGEREQVIYDLPPDQQSFVRQGLIAKQQGPADPPRGFAPAAATGEREQIHYPIIDEASRELAEKNVMTRAQFDSLEASARQKAFTVAQVESMDTLEKIRDVMAETIKEGVDLQTFRERILTAVDEGTFMSDAHLENVFRTNVQTAFSDGQMAVLSHPFVRGGFPYAVYEAIHDDRVRHEHLALETFGIEGTNIYRIDDPVFQLFRPPFAWNCRCSWIAMTVRQAARKGIKEAQQWLETGVEPNPPAFVPMPDFRPPAGFARSLNAAPLSIRLSMQPINASFNVLDSSGHEHKGKGEGGGQFVAKHGERASALHAKHAELKKAHEEHKQARLAAFNEVKADAEAALEKSKEHGDEITGLHSRMSTGDDYPELDAAYNELDELQGSYYESPSDQFQHLKEIESVALRAKKANAAIKPSTDGFSESDVAENAKLIDGIISNARESRKQLKAYVQHRKEMKAIKEGSPMDVQLSMLDDGIPFAFDESKVKRDDGGRFAEQASKIKHGELEHVGGIPVRRHSDDEYRIDTDDGHVTGNAEKIGKHIADDHGKRALHGRKRDKALKRAGHLAEADIFSDREQATADAEGFAKLPKGAKVVSLHPDTHGRVGEIVKDDEGRNRVKLEGTPGYASDHVEPLEEKYSWRAKEKQGDTSEEGKLFDELPTESKPQIKTSLLHDDTVLNGDERGAGGGFPSKITFGELKNLAKKKLGTRYHSVVVRKYGGGSQIEVLATKDGYHGREIVRKATYPLPDESAKPKEIPSKTATEEETAHFFRPKPEQGRLFSTNDEGKGHWITIGGQKGEDGKRHGGSPVYVENGRITKGHPSLTGKKMGALKEEGEHGTHRQQLHQSREHAKATWAKEARKHGVDKESLHQLADEMKQHHDSHANDVKSLLQTARQAAKKQGWSVHHANKAFEGGDYSQLAGFDELARQMAGQYPHLLGAHGYDSATDADNDATQASEKLFELLQAGNPEPMSDDDAYSQALEYLVEHKKVGVLDDVPFSLDKSGHEHKGKGPGGGQFTGNGDSGGEQKESGIDKLTSVGKKVVNGTLDLEHGAKEWAKKQFDKLPNAVKIPAAGFLKVFYGTYIVAQDAVDKVAKAQGMDEQGRHRLASVICAIDAAGMKGNAIAGGAVGGPIAATAASFVPVASTAYLAFSFAKNPVQTMTAAKEAVAEYLGKAKKVDDGGK